MNTSAISLFLLCTVIVDRPETSASRYIKQWVSKGETMDLLTEEMSHLEIRKKTSKGGVLYKKDFRINPSKLSVTTYNTKWLYLHEKKALINNQPMSKFCPWNPRQAIQHLHDVAGVLNQIPPSNIYILSEVQSEFVLDELRKLLVDGDKYSSFMVPGTDQFLGMNIGILSNIDPLIEPYRMEIGGVPRNVPHDLDRRLIEKTRIARNLVMELDIFDCEKKKGLRRKKRKIAILGVHLNSGARLPWPSNVRSIQCAHLADIVDDFSQNGYSVILAGDFNEFDKQVPDCQNNLPTRDSISVIKQAAGGMINTLQDIPKKQRFTTIYKTAIDYVFLDHSFLQHTTNIFNNVAFSTASDHYPVRVEIEL